MCCASLNSIHFFLFLVYLKLFSPTFQTAGWDTSETSLYNSTVLFLGCEPCSTSLHPTPPSWTPDLKPSPVNTSTSLWLLLISFQIRSEWRGSEERCYQTVERRGPVGRRCSHLSPATRWDNIRQGLNQQTGLTLGDHAGYLQLCGERSI